MRAVTGGSVVLGFAIVLLSWDASRRFIHVPLRPQMSPLAMGVETPRSAAPQVQAPAAPDVVGPKANYAPSAPTPAESSPSTARAAAEARRPASTAKRSAATPALPVREFPPGSKAHIEAIATAVDSEESRNMVAPLARLYFAFFDRVADYEGLNYWIGERDSGTSLDSIAAQFAGSEEFRIRYGSLDNAAFIDRVYRNVFDAPLDAANRAYWIAQLEAGASRGQVMLAFSESTAFRTASSNEVFVSMAFAEALRRAPDPGEFSRWVRFLDGGNPREAVITGLLAPRR